VLTAVPGIDDALLLTGAVVLLVELVAIIQRWPAAGIWLFGGLALASSLGLGGIAVAGTIQVYPLDYASLVLLGAVTLQLLIGRRIPATIATLVALFGFALLRGMVTFGLEPAVNGGRQFLYVLVGSAFAAVCARQQAWPAIERLWLSMSVVLVVVAAMFLAHHGFGTYAATGERALSASEGLIVGQAGVIALARPGRWYRYVTALGFFGVVLVTQQRTAWAATLVAMLVLSLREGPLRRGTVSARVRIAVSIAVVGALVLMLVGPAGLRESVSTATSTISTTSGTFGWRVQGWGSLLRSYNERDLTDRLVGQPLGAGFERVVRGEIVNVSPHNMYLTVLLSLGAAGLLAVIALYAQALRRTACSNAALYALVSGLVIFSVGYQIAAESALILGAALAGPIPARVPVDLRLRRSASVP
jgi:hypothetical protein